MKLPTRAALIGSLCLLAACAVTQPSVQVSMKTVRSENYGSYPQNYQRQVRQYLKDSLLDPDSAKIRISPPRRVFKIYNPEAKIYSPKTPNQLKAEGYYLVCAEVNAKNTYGGYTGWQTKRYRFTNGSMEDEQNFSYQNSIDSDACYSEDEIFIDTQNLDKLKVNIVP